MERLRLSAVSWLTAFHWLRLHIEAAALEQRFCSHVSIQQFPPILFALARTRILVFLLLPVII